MFRIKICGITRPEDARHAAAAGADAIGLNFYAASGRFVDASRAKEVASAVPEGICKVGVFVNEDAAVICETFDSLKLDLVQLHGDEPAETLRALLPRPVLRAIRLPNGNFQPVLQYLAQCRKLGLLPHALLVDAYSETHFGGTGKTLDWTQLKQQIAALEVPVVLAGGLRADNVAEAIELVRPAAVDTASGVESSPGRKDKQKLTAFIEAAISAFNRFA